MRYEITRDKYLTKSELAELESIIKNDWSRDAILIKIAIATGARAQEVLNISINDLDDKERSVLIHGLKSSQSRELYLNKPLYNALKTLALKSKSGKPFDIGYQRLHQIWAKYAPKNKSFKSLRHTAAVNVYKGHRDLLLAKALLGHVNIANTVIYADHVNQTEMLKKLRRGA